MSDLIRSTHFDFNPRDLSFSLSTYSPDRMLGMGNISKDEVRIRLKKVCGSPNQAAVPLEVDFSASTSQCAGSLSPRNMMRTRRRTLTAAGLLTSKSSAK